MDNHWLQQSIQQQQQHLLHQSDTFKNVYNTDDQISPSVAYFSGIDRPAQSQHPPYIPQFHVTGLAPFPVPAADGIGEASWNYGFEPGKKRLKEQDFLQTRSVSTGLALSLDNGRLTSSGDSSTRGIIHNEVDTQIHKHNADFDQYLRVQAEQFRREILKKFETDRIHTIAFIEQKVTEKLKEKEDELENINEMNTKLEQQIQQLSIESQVWQQRVSYSDNTIDELKSSIEQVNAQTEVDSKEGCGDSEVDDTASHYNRLNRPVTTMAVCKVCKTKEVCMLLLPCKHLCLCKDCENGIMVCPVCQSLKMMSLEILV